MAVYKMIPRWMPFSIPLYIHPIKLVFEKLKAKTQSLPIAVGDIEMAAETTQSESQRAASSNILNEPVSPRDYKLKHRKSIHEYFNPESASKMPQGAPEEAPK